MKVLFLDIDGVLNSEEFVRDSYNRARRGSFLHRDEDEIDATAVARLNRIIGATDAKVCISSTWRILHTLAELRGFLEAKGFLGELVGVTPRHRGENGQSPRRGLEIDEWIKMNDGQAGNPLIEAIVILDDDADMEHLIDRLVQTDGSAGLEDHHVERAIAMLGRPT